MPNLLIRNIPPELHRYLKKTAAENRRSLTQETILLMENAIKATQYQATPELLRKRVAITAKFLSGEASAALDGFEQSRAADHEESLTLSELWRG